VKEKMQMKNRLGRCLNPLMVAFLIAGVALWGGCSKDLVEADTTPPTDSAITSPADGDAVCNPIINVRGRAEVGATIEIYVNDQKRGSAVASPAVPYDGQLGRFTVEDVVLGEEGPKTLRGVVTDLYGNRAPDDLVSNILLDMTAPPVALEGVIDAEWEPDESRWWTGETRVTVVGRTDTTADASRMRYGINEFLPESTYVFPGAPGDPDSMRFWIPVKRPSLTVQNPDSLVHYYLEALDYAGNVGAEPVDIYWVAAGKETALSWDDGVANSYDHQASGVNGTMYAVRFDAPAWANYVIGMELHTGIDGDTNPENPSGTSGKPFAAYIWQPAPDLSPGPTANQGYEPFGLYGYPENELIRFYFPNAIDITDHAKFPNKQFLAGIKILYRLNPYIKYDVDEPHDGRTYRWDLTSWLEWGQWAGDERDMIIHAIVSDLEASGEARTAVIKSGTLVPLGPGD
jgi:hypothetical protein